MAAGLPDLVDCVRLAEDGEVLHRSYALGELVRLQGSLAAPQGSLRANFAFGKSPSGRCGAEVTIEAVPQLVCQRCMQGFDWPVRAGSEIEFAISADAEPEEAQRELVVMRNGQVSLRDLAEEELLLALPLVPACATPSTCGRAPGYVSGDPVAEAEDAEERRPFRALQDLLKKT